MKTEIKSSSIGRIHAFLLDIIFFFAVAGLELSKLFIGQPCRWLYGVLFRSISAPSSPELTAGGVLISVVLVWDTLFRSHISYTLSFLEEMWSRNLGNLFVSPLRPWELMLGLACISLIRTLIGMIPAALLAIPFFGVSVFEMGFPLFVFFFNLVLTGWAMSQFVTAILIRYGLGAESLTWVLPF